MESSTPRRSLSRVLQWLRDTFSRQAHVPRAGMQEGAISMLAGPSLLDLNQEGLANPVLMAQDIRDCVAASVRAPFMLEVAGRWHMLFEVRNRDSEKNEIGWATSDDAMRWTYRQIVLATPYPLSYPYVFEWNGGYYMLPQSVEAGMLRLYKAFEFPVRWALAGILLRGKFSTPSIVRHEDQWWLFTVSDAEDAAAALRLYRADELLGPWSEHPQSPIGFVGPVGLKLAGRVVAHEGRLVRFEQAREPGHGSIVRAFSITELTPTQYSEAPYPGSFFSAKDKDQNQNHSSLSHIDAHCLGDGRWMACVDRAPRLGVEG
ncbi:MAG: hypothetical protein LZF86_190397 [Nitrospira sp.]|nr:MAG: hypothetical protein LZF86_190397 [Nitrospira sp.]